MIKAELSRKRSRISWWTALLLMHLAAFLAGGQILLSAAIFVNNRKTFFIHMDFMGS
jgi:hypothetical protein